MALKLQNHEIPHENEQKLPVHAIRVARIAHRIIRATPWRILFDIRVLLDGPFFVRTLKNRTCSLETLHKSWNLYDSDACACVVSERNSLFLIVVNEKSSVFTFCRVSVNEFHLGICIVMFGHSSGQDNIFK